MTSNEPPQSQPEQPHSNPLSPKEELELAPVTPPHATTNAFYTSSLYQLPNFDFTKNKFAKSLKYQSPSKSFSNKECRSPSFFLDFANGNMILSPLSDTVPSQVGSTYTEKHLAFARTNEERVPISSFDTNITGIETSNDTRNKMSSPDEHSSIIVCKFETMEEENKTEEQQLREEEDKTRGQQGRMTRGRKKKEMEAEKMKETVNSEVTSEKTVEMRKTRGKSRSTPNKREDESKSNVGKSEQVQMLDALIAKLHKKVNQSEQVKEEAMVEEEKTIDYGVDIGSKNFSFESDSEERKELLTEEESLSVLKEMCQEKKLNVQFLSRLQGLQEITETVLIDEDGLRQNSGKRLKFFRADERTSGRILSLPEHMDELPLSLSKKISKLSNDEKYQCKYCGKQFQKGCALGGHISRLHKGESLNFRMRQETRKKRVADRTRGKFLRKESVKQLENKNNL